MLFIDIPGTKNRKKSSQGLMHKTIVKFFVYLKLALKLVPFGTATIFPKKMVAVPIIKVESRQIETPVSECR